MKHLFMSEVKKVTFTQNQADIAVSLFYHAYKSNMQENMLIWEVYKASCTKNTQFIHMVQVNVTNKWLFNKVRNYSHSHLQPCSSSTSAPTSYFYDALLPNKLLWCLESIRSNIPLFKTSWLISWGWGAEELQEGRASHFHFYWRQSGAAESHSVQNEKAHERLSHGVWGETRRQL